MLGDLPGRTAWCEQCRSGRTFRAGQDQGTTGPWGPVQGSPLGHWWPEVQIS